MTESLFLPEFSQSDSALSVEATESIERLRDLLHDLKVLEVDCAEDSSSLPSFLEESEQAEASAELDTAIALALSPRDRLNLPSLNQTITVPIDGVTLNDSVVSSPSVAVTLGLDQSDRAQLNLNLPILPADNCPELSAEVAFEQLQALLIEPQLIGVHDQINTLQQQMNQFEQQLYQPQELSTRLFPIIAKLLHQRVQESQEELINIIAPIIDQVIHNRMAQNEESMGRVLAPALPSALAQQVQVSSERIAHAIAPAMGQAIKAQINLEQDTIVDALYPIIGGTISKYLAETIREINDRVESTLSVEGIKRKIQAKIKGVSEAELILKAAIPFTVQAIFLIHKASGLVIAEVQPDSEHRLESELLAGMLTAIRSFANDCIVQSGSFSELDAIAYGTSKIVLEVAGYCYFAIITSGEPPPAFLTQMRQTLSALIQQHGETIEQFEGDPQTLPDSITTALQPLTTIAALPQRHTKKPPILAVLGAGLLALIGIPWGLSIYQAQVCHQVEMAFAATPELAIYNLKAQVQWTTLKLTGRLPNAPLRQQAEQVTQAVLPHWLVKDAIAVVDVPADPVLANAEVQRVTVIFNQTPGITITAFYHNEQVIVEGVVLQKTDAKQITQAYQKIPGIKGVSSTVQVEVSPTELRLYFGANMARPTDAAVTMTRLNLFLRQHARHRFKLIGYSSELTLALARVQFIRDRLLQQGLAPDRLTLSTALTSPPGVDGSQPDWLHRCVILRSLPLNEVTP